MSTGFDAMGIAMMVAEHLRELATRQERMPFATGDLRKSLIVEPLPDGAVVGSGLPYAPFVHDGTGLFGPRRQLIRPKGKKALYWPGAAHPVRYTRGMRPRPFLAQAVDELRASGLPPGITAAVGEETARALEQSLRGAGVEVRRG